MRPTRADLATVGLCAVTATGMVLLGGYGVAELLFFGVLLTTLAYLVRAGHRARAREQAARHAATELARVRPDRVAARAVREERRRLSRDIAAELGAMLVAVEHEAEDAKRTEDPGAAARRIHRHARQATSELRRLLGLLRAVDGDPAEASAPVSAPPAPPRPSGRDSGLAATAGVLALAESLLYPRAEGLTVDPGAVGFTVACAVTVIARTAAPAAGAATAAVVVAAAAATAHPVYGGFWLLLTLTGLVWSTCATAGAPLRHAAAGTLLAAAVTGSAWWHARGDAVVTTVIAGVVVTAAAVVRLWRSRAERAHRVAAGYRASLAETTAAALEADRTALAREIHDSVSHAVGVIAMQAGAAEVSATQDPETARRSLRLVAQAAADALADLDRLHPDRSPRRRGPGDLADLVERIRAAGTPVMATGLDLVPGEHADVVYRVVQEALTNVMRHGAGAPARVSLAVDEDRLEVVVSDDGPARPASDRRGFGLVGLAERVGHAGGELRSGPGAGGRGFVLEATLPRRAARVP